MAGIVASGQVLVTTSPTQIVASRGERQGLVIQNQGAVTVFIGEQQETAKTGHALPGASDVALRTCGWADCNATNLIGTRWPNLWCAHRLGHAVEHDDSLAAATGRKRLQGLADATVNVLPVVQHPDVACRVDAEIGLHL